jgi:hypothetical protein
MPQRKKRSDGDLLHKRAGRIALDLRNDRENLPINVRSDRRHRHRLRLDRGRRRSDPDCADLSHFHLDQSWDRDPEAAFLDGYARPAKGSVCARSFEVFLSGQRRISLDFTETPSSANPSYSPDSHMTLCESGIRRVRASAVLGSGALSPPCFRKIQERPNQRIFCPHGRD